MNCRGKHFRGMNALKVIFLSHSVRMAVAGGLGMTDGFAMTGQQKTCFEEVLGMAVLEEDHGNVDVPVLLVAGMVD